MVTNLKENKKTKCQQYWPDSDSKVFGPFNITLADQQVFANYTIRLLQVEVSKFICHWQNTFMIKLYNRSAIRQL